MTNVTRNTSVRRYAFTILFLGVLAAALILPLADWKRVTVVFVTLSVLVLELLNSSIERLVDVVKPRLHEYAGDIKDIMAAAVLLASLAAAAIGIVIFWPYLFQAIRDL